MLTLYFGPEEVLLNLELQFSKDLIAEEVAEAIERLEALIFSRYSSPHCALSTDTLRINNEAIELADASFRELSQ